MIIADLHIHSRYSRATAKNLAPEQLWLAAQLKGLDLVGTGDCTHPAWLAELDEKLKPNKGGAYELKPSLTASVAEQVPGPCQRPVRFLLSGEISTIYKRDGCTRKVHSLILLPDFAAAYRLNQRLGKLGNITSDGRPILGLDTRDLLELCLEVEPSVIFIPAHVWTPWFSLFGSKSGFDAVEECFDDLSGHVHALETGLSSDPAMNWRLSALDRFLLVSNSDAHSPAKLAREANLFTCAPDYASIAQALSGPEAKGLAGTLEFFPDEGKYHLDGHRKCRMRLTPAETAAHGGLCPRCGKPLTVGVLNRVEELADRPAGFRPPEARSFESLVPLEEVLAEVMQQGPGSKGVQEALAELRGRLGPDLFVLREAPLAELAKVGGPLLAEGLRRMRAGQVRLEGGYDGEFGVVRLFEAAERRQIKGQGLFWELKHERRAPKKAAAKTRKKKEAAEPLLTPLDPATDGLNDEQRAAVGHRGAPLLLRAGPGAGKTRVLVQRAVGLLAEGADPARMLMITFTRKAAAELAQRLAEQKTAAAGVRVATFHSLGREVLTQALGEPPVLLEPVQREAIIARLAREAGWRPGDLDLALTRLKQRVEAEPAPELAPLWRSYQKALQKQAAWDLDDLVRGAVLALAQDQVLAADWAGRFAHVLVDEYQDSNPAQVALLKALVAGGASLAAIGDPDQAIYGFRGADRSGFLNFARDFPGALEMALGRNYRNRGPVLAAAQGLMAGQPDPGRPQLAAQRAEGPTPVMVELGSPQAEAAWVARRIVELTGGLDSRQVEQGEPGGELGPRDIAVLYRLHAQAPPLVEALGRLGVPYQVAASEPLAETDPLDFKAQRVNLLSLHAAKGLEFEAVFIVGLEEGLLPYRPPQGAPADPEEERRLLYVGMTRARSQLFLSRCSRRTLFGKYRRPGPSPFLAEITTQWLEKEAAPLPKPRSHQMDLFG
ncbi:MAG: UvrD-helicase domain-containing protein [Thermodesulfobacteriota bacterium]